MTRRRRLALILARLAVEGLDGFALLLWLLFVVGCLAIAGGRS